MSEVEFLETQFGIEIELTGITREQASTVAEGVLSGHSLYYGGTYNAYVVVAPDGREWKFVSDSSIVCQKKSGRQVISASRSYSVELVSPILTYRQDMDTLQRLIRALRRSGGFVNNSCGIHVHLDGAGHTPRSLWNFVNLVASRNDLFYKAFQIPEFRQQYCKKMDKYMVETLNQKKPKTFESFRKIWYRGYHGSELSHYHDSRYHFLYVL